MSFRGITACSSRRRGPPTVFPISGCVRAMRSTGDRKNPRVALPPWLLSKSAVDCAPCASDGHATQPGLRPSPHRLLVEHKPEQIKSIIAIWLHEKHRPLVHESLHEVRPRYFMNRGPMISLFLYANSARELHKQRTDSERARSAGWHHRGYADTYRRVPDGTLRRRQVRRPPRKRMRK